jgi:hypothetical protein
MKDDDDDGRWFFLTRASLPLIVRKFILRMSFTQFFLNFDWPAFRAQRFFFKRVVGFFERFTDSLLRHHDVEVPFFVVFGWWCDVRPRYLVTYFF